MSVTEEQWQRMSTATREQTARALLPKLPAGFAFQSVRRFHLGNVSRETALFQFDGAEFALIPAAAVTLGFDVERWSPDAEERESWRGTAEDYGLPESVHEYLGQAMLRPRQVEVPALLIETAAPEVGWEPVAMDDPVVRQIRQEHPAAESIELNARDMITRVRRVEDGHFVAERALNRTHEQIAERLRTSGFRFPTSNEWEYACGCGEPTLFRWGDHVPCDRYPTDISPAEAAWRKNWVLSAGKLEYPPEGFASDWVEHRRPNAFGLSIASDPYKIELTNEIGVTRGGDGGLVVCGGGGFFMGWLALATAYYEVHSCVHDPAEPILTGYTVGRRVLELR